MILGGCAAPLEGARLAALYDSAETYYRADSKFRKDYAPEGFTLTSEDIARNFMKIAFETETQRAGELTIIEGGGITLQRWQGDITYALYGVTMEDRRHLDALTARLSYLTGHRIVETPLASEAKIRLLVVASDERRDILRRLRSARDTPVLDFIQAWSVQPSYPCIGSIASAEGSTTGIRYGMILIKAELAGDFRRACLTEEFVQTLGLLNDAPDVRPSIFNDDQEFIELTRHDEYLMRILYDPRLRIGMTREEARPIVREIARELLAGDRPAGLTSYQESAMSLWNRLTAEFIDVIDWTSDDGNTMVSRFERYGNEIKYGAKLTVREGQAAVFINEGQLADVFPPGMYLLETNNLPILSTLQHWDHGFQSPFKSEIYFVSLKRFTDLKWGTKNPVMMRDPEFGPTRLRAFGTYTIRVADPAVFLREIVGTDGEFTTSEIQGQLRNIIVSRFSNAVASSHIPVLDLAANYDDMGNFVRERIASEMAEYGLELTKLLVENVSLPPEVEKALDRRTQMGVIGDLQKYTQFQAAESMRAAADNPGDGSAAAGMGAGIGVALGNQMGAAMAGQAAAPAPVAPPPLPVTKWHVALDGAAQGPFGQEELATMAQDGRLTRDTLVWSQGMQGWEKAQSVSGLAALFSAMPPPLPPA